MNGRNDIGLDQGLVTMKRSDTRSPVAQGSWA